MLAPLPNVIPFGTTIVLYFIKIFSGSRNYWHHIVLKQCFNMPNQESNVFPAGNTCKHIMFSQQCFLVCPGQVSEIVVGVEI